MKIYTKTGDDGTTSLFGGQRVSKSDKRVVAYGTIDELNSFIGLSISLIKSEELKSDLIKIQNELFTAGSYISTPLDKLDKVKGIESITEDDVTYIEKRIDYYSEQLPGLKNFILPGGSLSASALHIARTVCRRCEREIINLKNNVYSIFVKYFNRLSDFLFIAARFENKNQNVDDVLWKND